MIKTYPVEIIPGFLYVATFQQSQDHRIIKDLKVKANVIVTNGTDSMQVISYLPSEKALKLCFQLEDFVLQSFPS